MNQTSSIFAALTVGFIIFIVMRGELPAYLKVLGLSN